MAKELITFKQVSKQYEDGTKAVADANFTIDKGEFFVLIGPSGCGKTTTLKMINRLIPPTAGEIFINGANTSNGNIDQLRWNIGYVLQQIALFPHMTVANNIAIVPELKGWNRDKTNARIDELLSLVGLDQKPIDIRLPGDLSGGQQQRVGVARALAADPDILLMDEPFSALDPVARASLQKDIKALQRDIKKTIVFVTHDMEEAKFLGDRIGMMEDGHVLQIGTAQELIENPASHSVARFLRNSDGFDQTSVQTVGSILTPIEESEYVTTGEHQSSNELQFVLSNDDELKDVQYLGKSIEQYQIIHYTDTLEQTYHQLEQCPFPALPVLKGDKCMGVVSYQNLAKLAVQPSLHHA
ncbi:LOW QUALITY PROTEIN: L-proline glycine betaine ABC transport system permease protein ProV [Bacillus sp. JCM 19047]|nr:LOW QUALITY PROTEIN: L-proline glycine betaine ABC transport system permease protein ProV [Bacillus sp. JCM 19047]